MPDDALTWLREVEAAMTPKKWRGRAFADGPGGVWAESSAAVFTCPSVEHADMVGTAVARNLFPAALAVIEGAREVSERLASGWRHSNGACATCAAESRLKSALDAFTAAVREEQAR